MFPQFAEDRSMSFAEKLTQNRKRRHFWRTLQCEALVTDKKHDKPEESSGSRLSRDQCDGNHASTNVMQVEYLLGCLQYYKLKDRSNAM